MNRVFYQQQLFSFFSSQSSQGPLWRFWIFLLPIVPLVAYMFLGFVKILPDTDNIPRPIYIVTGMTCWLMFFDAISSPFRSIQSNKHYFIRQEISLNTLLSAWMPERLFSASIQLAFCIGMVAVQLGVSAGAVVGFLSIYILGALSLLSIGYLLAIVGMISPSTMNLVDISNRFLLFLSGVIFPLPSVGITGLIQVANPYYVFVENARRVLLDQPLTWTPLLAWLVVGATIWLFVLRQFPKVDRDVREFLQ